MGVCFHLCYASRLIAEVKVEGADGGRLVTNREAVQLEVGAAGADGRGIRAVRIVEGAVAAEEEHILVSRSCFIDNRTVGAIIMYLPQPS